MILNTKSWITHLSIRLAFFIAVIGIFLLLLKIIPASLPAHITELRVAVYAGAAITALLLMAESIILLGRNQIKKLLCNLGTILFIIFFIVFTIQRL